MLKNSNRPQVRGLNPGIKIKNQGLRLLALGLSATANPENVNSHSSGRKKSRNFQMANLETGSPSEICTRISVG